MKVFLLLSLLALYNVYSINYEYIFLAKCPSEKTKTKMCAFPHIDKTTSKKEFLIFDKCGKGKTCDYSNTKMCVGDQKKKKLGGACNYDEDCAEGTCASKKCTALSEGQVCGTLTSGFIGHCGVGLTCYMPTVSDTKCIRETYTVGTELKDAPCGFGLLDGPNNKCQKYGTFEDGTETKFYGEMLCKSGLAHGNEHTGYICDSITADAICEEKTCDLVNCPDEVKEEVSRGSSYSYLYTDEKNKIHYVSQTSKAQWAYNNDGGIVECTRIKINGEYIVYPSTIKLQSVFYKDFIKDFDKLDLKKINTEDKYYQGLKSLKWETYKKYLLFQNASLR